MGAISTTINLQLPDDTDNKLYWLKKRTRKTKQEICLRLIQEGVDREYTEERKKDMKKGGS